MVVPGRGKSIGFFIALAAGLISVILLLYVGWFLFGWRTGILLFLGVLLGAVLISGIVLNTVFLVREIRRNEQQDAFINAVTHELKTPVASIGSTSKPFRPVLSMNPSAAISIASCWRTAIACSKPSSRSCAP